jgi:hypothetical protein
MLSKRVFEASSLPSVEGGTKEEVDGAEDVVEFARADEAYPVVFILEDDLSSEKTFMVGWLVGSRVMLKVK